jgi:hypothetical protein
MGKSLWEELRGKELRYRDHTWELTGDVDVRESGELLAVETRRVDDVRHGRATLYFGLENAPDSLNPEKLGQHFDRLERKGSHQYLVVKKEGRTYRYELRRLEHE